MDKKIIEVVAALVRRGDEFLICRRPMHKARGGQWEFAGGKVESGETKQQAIIREFREELDLELEAGDVIADVTHAYPDITVHLSLLETRIASGTLRNKEHSEVRWITLREVHRYDFCPADRIFVRELLRREWMAEQECACIHGWDFSHLKDRWADDAALPWDYRSEILNVLCPQHRVLDIDTGGGEFLLGLGHPHDHMAATENYPPNVALCREKLLPLNVDFRAGGADNLPFPDASFDLVINRHGDFDVHEIHRVLKAGGLFITQQVGAQNDRELVELLLPGAPLPFPEQHLHISEEKFRRAGFEILRSGEAFRNLHFYDVGALVWFARVIEWEFPGFSVEDCLENLYHAQEILAEKGVISGKMHRFFFIAQKS